MKIFVTLCFVYTIQDESDKGRHDTRLIDTQHNDILHKDVQHNRNTMRHSVVMLSAVCIERRVLLLL